MLNDTQFFENLGQFPCQIALHLRAIEMKACIGLHSNAPNSCSAVAQRLSHVTSFAHLYIYIYTVIGHINKVNINAFETYDCI